MSQDDRQRLPGEVDTLVVGAGQAGLSAGYYLKQVGLPFAIVDAHGRVGDSWRNRWDSLRLFTTARYDGLPGRAFPGSRFHYPTKDELADYLEGYARHFDLPTHMGVEIDSLTRAGDRFEVSGTAGSVTARNVIVASGFDHRPQLPDFAGQLDPDLVQLHSKEYRNPAQLRKGAVLVVGAANSGAEIAVELARSGHEVFLSGRDPGQEPTGAGTIPDRLLMPLVWFAATRVLKVDNKIGRKVRDQFLDPPRGLPVARIRRKDIVRAGIERVPRTQGVREGRPLLDDGRVLDVANVIWCTGFEPGHDWIDLPIPTKHGAPIHERGVIESQPGLYFLGLTFQYSLNSSLVGGVGRDAKYVVDHLASTRSAVPGASARSSGPG